MNSAIESNGGNVLGSEMAVLVNRTDTPTPREVFDDPGKYWSFLTAPTDSDFEGQYFDRKEACRPQADGSISKNELSQLREQVRECISAFANKNQCGGLLVLGISSKGETKGFQHLDETQRNSLTDIDGLLRNQACDIRLFDCINSQGNNDTICLIYVHYTQTAICETPGHHPKAWTRQGVQNILLSDHSREQLKRNKRVVDFERAACCQFQASDLDMGVLSEFKASYLECSSYQWTDEDLLYQLGALTKETPEPSFTNAGLLFFSANPQRVFPAAHIRLLRFDIPYSQRLARPLPSFEKEFTGPLTKQLRDFRTFIQETGFFKKLQRRNPTGGFIEEPEFPFIAVDEAIVNAVAHRDYAIGLPIICEKYTDAFIVKSYGTLIQLSAVPSIFSLDNTSLEHLPRNPMLIGWLKQLKDAKGTSFVRALSEGTRKMRDEMSLLKLPAPKYETTDSSTTVILFNNIEQREANLKSEYLIKSSEFTNCYPLVSSLTSNVSKDRDQALKTRKTIIQALRSKLEAGGWFVDDFRYGVLTAHRRGVSIDLPQEIGKLINLYPAYIFQIREYWGKTYLTLDYTLSVQSILTALGALKRLGAAPLIGLTAIAKSDTWQRGKILEINEEWCRIYLFDMKTEEVFSSQKVIPKLPRRLIDQVLSKTGINFDLAKEIKRASLSIQSDGARLRAERIQATVNDLAVNVFPLSVGDDIVEISPAPFQLSTEGDGASAFKVEQLQEPMVEFKQHQSCADIREGITRFGSYENTPRDIEIIPICSSEHQSGMRSLIERLRVGKFKYKGSEKTFSTRINYNSVITVPVESIKTECERLLQQYPSWIGDNELRRIFLVHCPERGYSLDDETAPYYQVKRFLLENGLPCQMVDTPTLTNPDYKDLNLALNIMAKTGIAPWVLPESIPEADFFIGLSYTQHRGANNERLMGFANVFNSYGRWEFYSGGMEVFSYDNRASHYESLIYQTLSRLSLPEAPNICFHYSAKFSQEDRAAILKAARKVRPKGIYSFVWINTHHNVRFFDNRPETNGSLSRGRFVIGSPNQIYLSTTGYNPYRKVLGTPQALEINVRVEKPNGVIIEEPDMRAIATQVLSLTKLNWASSDSLCAEPITTKYAGDIAYLTAAFLRQNTTFRLHPALERTPWFI